ncbi:hypothetical protein [Hyphomicrobium sp.]|uniref:hypothetical protein n=1 Tax=Hyphomicrobium sp. TaxID=82 RepID=UPI0025BA6EBF|nr:hypothetical protein [Hyphomicrobium sp.]MCC7250445.1 hypothetical protein [Hyphomicrobium sp.]
MSQETTAQIKAALRAAFEKAMADQNLSPVDAVDLLSSLLLETIDTVAGRPACAKPLPDTAPELWENRIGRKDNPVTFTRRVYAPWIEQGLTRSALRRLDPLLYNALAVWQCRHPEEDRSWLPSNSVRACLYPVDDLARIREALEPLQERRRFIARLIPL